MSVEQPCLETMYELGNKSLVRSFSKEKILSELNPKSRFSIFNHKKTIRKPTPK